jgi:hypothetical protein
VCDEDLVVVEEDVAAVPTRQAVPRRVAPELVAPPVPQRHPAAGEILRLLDVVPQGGEGDRLAVSAYGMDVVVEQLARRTREVPQRARGEVVGLGSASRPCPERRAVRPEVPHVALDLRRLPRMARGFEREDAEAERRARAGGSRRVDDHTLPDDGNRTDDLAG